MSEKFKHGVNEGNDNNIQATVVCDAHLSCCDQKGCPGEYLVLPNSLAWTGRCCHVKDPHNMI